MIDACIPIGRGQRQLIIGDRGIGKTSIFIMIIITSSLFSYIGSIDGFGSKRIFCIYIGINQNLSKISKLITLLLFSLLFILLSTHSSSPALLSFIIPLLGIRIAENIRDRGFDCCICFDDCSLNLLLHALLSYTSFFFLIHSSFFFILFFY
jgi:F-type H+-transporting ATPase subunit alpha